MESTLEGLEFSKVTEDVMFGIDCGDKQEEFKVDLLHLDFYLIRSEKYDLTGVRVWPGARLLSRYLVKHVYSQFSLPNTYCKCLHTFKAIELGAGTGLAGLVASKLFQSVVITDSSAQAVSLIQKNISMQPFPENMQGRLLSWGESSEQQFDIALASDIVYPDQTSEAFESLFETLNSLLSVESRLECPLENSFICGFVHRCFHASKRFFEAAESKGWGVNVMRITDDVVPPGRTVDDTAILQFTRDPIENWRDNRILLDFTSPQEESSSEEETPFIHLQ